MEMREGLMPRSLDEIKIPGCTSRGNRTAGQLQRGGIDGCMKYNLFKPALVLHVPSGHAYACARSAALIFITNNKGAFVSCEA